MLVPMKTILDDAYKRGYGVGAFSALDLLTGFNVIRAAEKKGIPVILLCEVTRLDSQRDNEVYFQGLHMMAREAKVPVATILDHGASYEDCINAIHLGFSTVMFDGSALPNEVNAAETKRIVAAAHAAGVSVEAEIGHVSGNEAESVNEANEVDSKDFTTPEDAAWFAKETGVDALAVAIGSVHGTFKSEPHLDIKRLEEIRMKVGELPLVLHGGSGIDAAQFQAAIRTGIQKINIHTSMALNMGKEIKNYIEKRPGMAVTFEEIAPVADKACQEEVMKHMDVFMTKHMTF